MKICQENANWVKIGQESQELYLKIMFFTVSRALIGNGQECQLMEALY